VNFRSRYRPELPSFQIAPMIDIVLTMLFFFIASQIFSQWETEIDIKLPTAQEGNVPARLPGEIIINIRQDGTVTVNRQELDSAQLSALLDRVAVLFQRQPVLIRADKATAYEHVIRVLDLCRRAKIGDVSFATMLPEKPGARD
jgi:biopolymer transport protein ExbD